MIKKVVNGAAKAVSRIVKGVKNECRLELDGSEDWKPYTTENWAGVMLEDYLSKPLKRAAHYSNYFGFTQEDVSNKIIWVGVNSKYLFLVWPKGKLPVGYEHWEKDGKGDIAAIKADLAKKHLIIWYDNTNSAVGNMNALIPLIARDITKVKKVVDVTDQTTKSVGNFYWNENKQEWYGRDWEFCIVGNIVDIIDKYGLQKYVLEFDVRADIAGVVKVYDKSGGKYKYTFIDKNLNCSPEWQHFALTGEAKLGIDGGNECNIAFSGASGSGRIPHIKNFRIRTAVDVFTHVTSEVADGVIEVSPAEVTNGVLTLKGDNVKVENNKLIIK